MYVYVREQDIEKKMTETTRVLEEYGVKVTFYTGECVQNEIIFAPQKSEMMIVTDNSLIAKLGIAKDVAVVACLNKDNQQEDFSNVRYLVENMEEIDADYYIKIFERLTGQPWHILDTKRCIIRETKVEDVDAFYDIYSEPMITKYMENLFEDREAEIQYTKDYIEKVYGFYGFGMWTVVLKETNEVIGRAGLSIREGFDEPELGFVIGVKWQRKGLAYEVCREILEYGKEELGFATIQAFVEPRNHDSMRICKKLDFQIMGKCKLYKKDYYRLILE